MADMHSEYEFLRPLTSGWTAKLELARKSRAKWKEIADECMMFYSKSAAAMWDPKYQRKFWKGVPAPRFRVTINKAFEMVAVFGPSLIWDVPHRQVESKKQLDIPIELFGNPEDQQVQAFYQQTIQQAHSEKVVDNVLSFLLESWLNYTPREMPGGGLEEHSMLAVVDALIKGRGVLWTKPYKFPGSERMLTGCFREAPENLFIDPDFNTIDDAKWIAIRKIAPVWETERRFGLKKDTLKDRTTLESAWAQAEYRTDDEYYSRSCAGQTNDMMEYYEIWSKTGPGTRLTGMQTSVKGHLEETVGDYAWIVVAPNVPFPLNCPSEGLRGGMSSEEVRQRFQWPIETWRDDRWPIEVLDFYPDPDSAWPVAPLAPALGELKFLNVMIPHLMNRIWSSSRDFWAVMEPAYAEFKTHLQNGADQTIFPIPTSLGTKISDIVSVLQQPQTNLDVWRIIEAVSDLFDKRTGLTDFVYGTNTGGTQDRTAETTSARKQAAGVRPQYMSKMVHKWQSRAAAQEAFCARIFVSGKDVEPLLGQVGSQMWDTFVKQTDAERVARQMAYSIAASSIKRPDKDREIANMNQAITTWLPIAAGAAQASRDYSSVNAMMDKWGDAAEMDMDGIQIPPTPPDPAEEQAQQMEMQKMQLETQKMQVELEGKQMELQGKQMEIQGKQALMQVDLQSKTAISQLKQAEQQQGLQIKTAGAQLDLAVEQAKVKQDMGADGAKHVQDMTQDIEVHEREMRQDNAVHHLDMLQKAREHEQKLKQQKELEAVKVQMAKKAKPAEGSSK